MKCKRYEREEVLTIPLSAEEKQRIYDASHRHGLTMSAFARIVIFEHLKKEGERE